MFVFYKVTCKFNWENRGCEYSFATLEGAKKWLSSKDDLDWYSIEGYSMRPCDDNDPDGQLYYGMIYNEFVECNSSL